MNKTLCTCLCWAMSLSLLSCHSGKKVAQCESHVETTHSSTMREKDSLHIDLRENYSIVIDSPLVVAIDGDSSTCKIFAARRIVLNSSSQAIAVNESTSLKTDTTATNSAFTSSQSQSKKPGAAFGVVRTLAMAILLSTALIATMLLVRRKISIR